MVKSKSKTVLINIIALLMIGLVLLIFEYGENIGTLLAK